MGEPAPVPDEAWPRPGDAPATYRVVYVLGAGRSGTTLMDIMLGNAEGGFSCGELRKFIELDGRPSRSQAGSACWNFWDGVRQELRSEFGAREWARLGAVARRLEGHEWFPLSYLRTWPVSAADRALYGRYVNRLFGLVSSHAGARVLVDSSKYPGRLLALLEWLEAPLDVVYVRRARPDVVRSFGKRDVEQPPKGWLAANTYYLSTHAMCGLAYRRVAGERRRTVRYRDLLDAPGPLLEGIGTQFGIDLGSAAETARQGGEFRVGHLLDGNRIRRETAVRLHRPGRTT